MEKIISILEGTFSLNEEQYYSYDGFTIITDKQTIQLGISNDQCCCESFGYLMSEDDIQSFLGAELKSIIKVDQGLNEKCIEAGSNLDLGGAMFVNLETSKGLLQFVAYNGHNGYYGHEAVVISTQLNLSESL